MRAGRCGIWRYESNVSSSTKAKARFRANENEHSNHLLRKQKMTKTSLIKYENFIKCKAKSDPNTGLTRIPTLNPMLHQHQSDMVRWALRRGRAAIFADCGLGKGPMQMEWATQQPHECIIAAPLAVAHQFVREAEKFGIDLAYAKDHAGITRRITVTNYERLENFNIEQFGAVALDESSILKNQSGAYSTWMIDAFKNTPFRLCSSATPAPNDVMEIGTQAEFLGVMTRGEMLAMYFTHDGGDTSKWRVKGHAQASFWSWMASWAVMIRKPSDLGYSDDGFILPPLHMHEQCVKADSATPGYLFAVEAHTLQERQQARRDSISDRVNACASIVNASEKPFLVWCNLNGESEALAAAIPGAVEVTGSDTDEHKEKSIAGFLDGSIRVLISKPKIMGLGLNFQHCADMAYVGLSDSYEQLYQSIRRCWRFGQINPVNVHIITAETEGAVVSNIKRKEREAEETYNSMIDHMKDLNEAALHGGSMRNKTAYEPVAKVTIPAWLA